MEQTEPTRITRRQALQMASYVAAAAVLGAGCEPRTLSGRGNLDSSGTLYVSLRNSVLGPHNTRVNGAVAHRGIGHFLTNGRFSINLLQERSELYLPSSRPGAGTPLGSGDNPLLNTGKLLIALAIESALGSQYAVGWVDAALNSLASLFPFTGEFAGYPLRRDPVSSHDWSDQPVAWPMFPPPARYSANFLIDDVGSYQLLASTHDWRRSRRVSFPEFPGLSTYSQQEWARRHKRDDMARLRESEPSSDEIVGLITGLFCVWSLMGGRQKTSAVAILARLAEYLAEHSYFLVRPAGGFSSRGPASGSVAGEFVSQRVFARVLGNPHAARHSVPTVLRSAGLWQSLEAGWNVGAAYSVAFMSPLLLPVLNSITGGLGLPGDPATAFLEFLVGAGANPAILGGALSLSQNQAMFDCETRLDGDSANDRYSIDDEYPMEIVLGTVLTSVPAWKRLHMYMTDWAANSMSGWAVGFMPFLGLSALGDPDSRVRDDYLRMFDLRTLNHYGWADWKDNSAPRAAFPTAVALLLTADANPRSARVRDLESALVKELASLAGYFNSLDEKPMTVEGTTENANPALDYLVAVSLAWLHRKRQADGAVRVDTPGFPVLPTRTDLVAPQFRTMPKPPIPAPVLPVDPPRMWHETVTVYVGPPDGVVSTGVFVSPLDEVEITASGQIDAGELLDGLSGPDGWTAIADANTYAMTGADAHKYALIGRVGQFGAYFPIGSHLPRRRFRYEIGGALELLINTWNTAKGSKQFSVKIDRWSNIPPEQALIKTADDPTVYLIRHGTKSLLLTPAVLTVLLGRKWDDVRIVTTETLRQIPDGATLVPFGVAGSLAGGPRRRDPLLSQWPELLVGHYADGATIFAPGDWGGQYWTASWEGGELRWKSVTGPVYSPFGSSTGYRLWTADFTGAGQTQLLSYGQDIWTLAEVNADETLTLNNIGNTARFGNLADGRPMWVGDFSGTGRASVLFHFSGDGTWWEGRTSGGQLGWQEVALTSFGDTYEWPHWVGRFTNAPGGTAVTAHLIDRDQIIMYSLDHTYLGTVYGPRMYWVEVSGISDLGNLADSRILWLGNFTGGPKYRGVGRTSILSYTAETSGWHVGTVDGNPTSAEVTWKLAGTWKPARDTKSHGDISSWQHWVGSFSAPYKDHATQQDQLMRDQVMIYSLNDVFLVTISQSESIIVNRIDGASDYGNLADGRPIWFGDFTGTGRTSILFYAAEDFRWWLGTIDGNPTDVDGNNNPVVLHTTWNLAGEGVLSVPVGPG